MDNPEKLATQGTQEKKKSKAKTQHNMFLCGNCNRHHNTILRT